MISEPEDIEVPKVPAYDQVLVFDPDEFATVFSWATKAAAGKAQVSDPSKRRIGLIEPDGSVTELQINDTPLARLFVAIQERYGEISYKKYFSASSRILALLDLVESGRLAAWVRDVPGHPDQKEIAESVIEAAATARFNREYKFAWFDFLRRVKEIEAGWGR